MGSLTWKGRQSLCWKASRFFPFVKYVKIKERTPECRKFRF